MSEGGNENGGPDGGDRLGTVIVAGLLGLAALAANAAVPARSEVARSPGDRAPAVGPPILVHLGNRWTAEMTLTPWPTAEGEPVTAIVALRGGGSGPLGGVRVLVSDGAYTYAATPSEPDPDPPGRLIRVPLGTPPPNARVHLEVVEGSVPRALRSPAIPLRGGRASGP